MAMQDYLDSKLIRRLLRPVERPGIIDRGLSWEIAARSQQFANRLPLVSHLTQRLNRKIGIRGEEIPIVYARSQPQETPTTNSISTALGQSPSSQRTVVQAKFVASAPLALTPIPSPIEGEGSQSGVPVVSPIQGKGIQSGVPVVSPIQGEGIQSGVPAVSPIQGEGSQTTNSVDSVGWGATAPAEFPGLKQVAFETVKPNPTSELGIAIARPNPQSLSAERDRADPMLETPSSQRTVVQAKFATGSDRQPEGLSPETTQNLMPIVRARSQPLPTRDRGIFSEENLPVVPGRIERALVFDPDTALPNLSGETIPNPPPLGSPYPRSESKIQNLLETPLIFSKPRVNPESVKTELGVQNPSITGISRTESIPQTPELSRAVSPYIQSNEEPNRQPDRQERTNVQNPLDLEALTDKVERKLMQRLIIESERRGRTTWS